MSKADLGQTRQFHVSESYALSECANKPGYEVLFKWSKKGSYFNELNN